MNIREIGIFERLEELARSQPETTALVCEDKQLKYRELPEIIRRLLNGMLEEGIEKGERIALLMDNCNEYLLLIATGFRLGSISVCINTRTGIDEIKKVVEQTTPSGLKPAQVSLKSPALQPMMGPSSSRLQLSVESPREPCSVKTISWLQSLHT